MTLVPRVRSISRRRTIVPATVTLAVIASLGRTPSLTGCETSGTASYQAVYRAVPAAVQFDSVPVCSSAWELVSLPPRPTHEAEYVACPAGHVTAGTVQVPITLRKRPEVRVTAYPAQLELVADAVAACAPAGPRPAMTPVSARARARRVGVRGCRIWPVTMQREGKRSRRAG